MKKYTLSTRLLTSQEFVDVFSNIFNVLKAIVDEEIVIVRYGWACNIHNDLQFIPMHVGIGWIKEFLNDSMRRKIYIVGNSDLTIESNAMEIQFCHESDIHFTAESKETLDKIKEMELLKKYFFESTMEESEISENSEAISPQELLNKIKHD